MIEIKNNDVFQGTITQQELLMARNGTPFLKLTVNISGKLLDARRKTSPVDPIPEEELTEESVQIFLDSTPEGQEKLAKNLTLLDFQGEDLTCFDPGHPDHKKLGNFVGRSIHLRAWRKDDGKLQWQLNSWNAFEKTPAGSADLTSFMKNAGSTFRGALKKAREAKAAPTATVPY